MNRGRIRVAAVLCFAAAIGVANASWYDDYDAGIKAAQAGNWAKVVDSMTKAINGNAKESNNARTYGAIFINYHPFYYRGVANMNLGKYEQAIADFEKTSGPGPLDLGSVGENIRRAKAMASGPEVTQTTATVAPPPPPSIDPALRTRADAALTQARERLEAAQQRNATSTSEYKEAMQQYRDVNRQLNAANSNDDLRKVISLAGEVVFLANSAIAPVIDTSTTATTATTATVAVEDVLGTTRKNLRLALESYFEGDFVAAERKFKGLTTDLPRNPWIWAFLGASQWSRYAFETEDDLRREAIKSFRKAKQNGWKGDLPPKYFSRRIRNAFKTTAG